MPASRRHALALFQQMSHLNITGEFDDATENTMKQPRCGSPDIRGGSKRRKRFVADSKNLKSLGLFFESLVFQHVIDIKVESL